MITPAGLALCAAMGVQCHSIEDLENYYVTHRPEPIIWMRQVAVLGSGNFLAGLYKYCPPTIGHIEYLGTDPYSVWACLKPKMFWPQVPPTS